MQPDVQAYRALPMNITMKKTPGKPRTTSYELDTLPSTVQERALWLAVRGQQAYQALLNYRRANGIPTLAEAAHASTGSDDP